MNKLPVNSLPPEAQQRTLRQLYALMEKQVRSYTRHRHMGEHSSIPAELARDMIESISYTVGLAGGVAPGRDLEEALRLGQAILDARLQKAKDMLELVSATAPRWQTECRWEALGYLRRYLANYDPAHLAHKGPEGLFYPVPVPRPEGIQGMDCCNFYLQAMWIENQIMDAVPEEALGEFFRRLPVDTLNPCEPLLTNGLGKALLKTGIDPLVFTPEDHRRIGAIMAQSTEKTLQDAAERLARWLDLKNEPARAYVEAVIPRLTPWIGGENHTQGLENLFIS